MRSEPVWAVVVTHNRKELLIQCLEALLAQTRSADTVLVVDNASTDGTAALVRERFPRVRLLPLPVNEQCAGGFHEGLRTAHEGGAEWIWLLDDDAVPLPEALAGLLAPLEDLGALPEPLLLAGRVVWDDGQLHPMNAPGFRRQGVDEVIGASDHGLMPIRSASFVSLCVNRAVLDRFGLPHKHFVIYGDDTEWTARILRAGSGYMVPGSIVHHRTKAPATAISSAASRFYYHVRNTVYMLRGTAWTGTEKLSLVWVLLASSAAHLRGSPGRTESLLAIGRGVRDGLRRPAVEVQGA